MLTSSCNLLNTVLEARNRLAVWVQKGLSVLVADFPDCILAGSCGCHCLASPKGVEFSIANSEKEPNSSTVSTEYHFCTMGKPKNLISTRCKSGTIYTYKGTHNHRGVGGGCQLHSEPQTSKFRTSLMQSPHLFKYHSLEIN